MSTDDHVSVEIESSATPVLKKSGFDNMMLQHAVQDTGRWAYDTVFVEVWVRSGSHLFRPETGWWVDPSFHPHGSCKISDCDICRLVDQAAPNFLPAKPLSAGVGLPGILWSETDHRRSSFIQRKQKVYWRDVAGLAADPDQPFNERLKTVARILDCVGVVPFDVGVLQGIVVYLARKGADQKILRSKTNEDYLLSASELIGSVCALRGPRLKAIRDRNRRCDAALRRVRFKLVALIRLGVSLDTVFDQPQEPQPEGFVSHLQSALTDSSKRSEVKYMVIDKIRAYLEKCKGGAVPPPPSFNIHQSIFTFFGVFITLLCVSSLNVYIGETYGSDFTMSMGPFGALVTLQYGLTAAPASQPTNALLGQAIALSIALGISKLENVDVWLREALATALAVSVMVKLGITHPPAAAAALIFSGGNFGWTNMAFMLIGNVIAIAVATLINNLNSKRQYPTAWGSRQYAEKLKERMQSKKET